jgi:hypothetical protein
MLHFVNEAHPTLNFLIKTLRKQDFKLILVNKAARTITVDFEVIMDEFMKANFDLKVSPGQKVYYPQSIITVGLLLQQKHSSRVDRVENMRALVVGKVRECSVKFTYPCVFQQQTGNVSGVDAE